MNPTRTASEPASKPAGPLPGQQQIFTAPANEAEPAQATAATVFVSMGKPASQRQRTGRRFWLSCGVLALTISLAYAGFRWWDYSRTWVKTDNAYVAAHVHMVSARVAGTVVDVLVDEHSPVTAGSVLARLDPRDFEIRKAQATAQLAQAQAQQRQAQARLAEARAQVAREQARTGKARLDLDRARSLYRGSTGAISKQEFDQAAAEAEGAEAALEAARASVGSAEALVAVADAQRQVAQAGLDDAELQLFYTQIIAPVDGRIGKKNLEVGNRVQAGQPLLGLVQPEVWITANYKETQLARIRPGQPVRIRIDAFPGRHFSGQVASLSPASGAQFALLPPDNATGNFTRIVQRVPVKILLTGPELTEYAGCLVPGMSAIAEVKAGGT